MGGKEVTTLEGLQEEAAEFGAFLAAEGAEQCGYCSPGFIMNVLAMVRELEDPTLEEVKEYLAGICADVPGIWDNSARSRNI